jgi:hypothetical protein
MHELVINYNYLIFADVSLNCYKQKQHVILLKNNVLFVLE